MKGRDGDECTDLSGVWMIGETKMKPLLQAFLLFNVKPLLSHHTI